jgi:tetratricopeptide (TPR) repeat protein
VLLAKKILSEKEECKLSRISTIVSEAERKITDEKSFMQKFSFLLTIIVGLSAYIIVQGFNVVDDLSSPYENSMNLVSLEMVERKINGNSVNLVVIEDDFSELASIDLSGISLFQPMQNRPVQRYEQNYKQNVRAESRVEKSIKENKKKVFITSQDGNSLSFIKKKFYATNNAVFSIKLAQKFYETKKYQQALKWSLITNEIDSKNEQSWLMFAKIKDKMGKKQDAINALNEYLKRENSTKAISLLKEIKKSV